MRDESFLAGIDFDLARDSAFSYQCNACCRCCHHKIITVGPYEILRLARHLGMTTTDFIAQHTEAGGTALRRREQDDDACSFLTVRGCGVHPDRPLVCRIYPLARWRDGEGRERFGHVAPHPQTEGIYGHAGTIADFLEQQGASPYLDVVTRYVALYWRMVDALERLDPAEFDQRASRRADVETTAPGLAASPWLDIDRAVAEYCKAQGRPLPDTIEATVAVHIESIESWIVSL